MLYRYTVYTSEKKVVSGTVESVSVEIAEDSLYKAGYKRILDLEKIGGGFSWKRFISKSNRIKTDALMDFTMEVEILTESGMTLLMALKQLEKQSTDNAMKEIINSLVNELEGGTPFHQALRMFPQVFSESYICIIEANERSGTLDTGLRQVTKQLKQQIAISNNLKGAVTQPAIILGVAVLVAIVLAVVVLPQLINVFTQFGEELPWNAKLLIALVNFITEQKINILLAIFLIVVVVIAALKHPKTKPALDKWVFNVPLIGRIVSWNNTAYFSRILSNLLSAGILLPDGISIMLRGITNTYFRESLSEARKKLIQGQSLSASLSQNNIFPPLLVELIGVGEASGNLDSALGTVADYFESKVEKRVNKLISFLEPALIICISLGVGFLAVTMISSIYGLVGNFKG